MEFQKMNMALLQYLKAHGEQLDADLSKALRIPMAQIRKDIAQLAQAGEVICCQVTRFRGETKIEGVSCRMAAYSPPKATGPKPGAKKAAAANANANAEANLA
jgi:hypothetical protein